ncbi:uncharacterized protein LOC113774219 [Coffea eugenioides]|uniref:uncharacterized protein LOC113774219 n=1 Tax=Coffea eugenioides TaxID=49369 RepID=UPI000F61121A|nr:uncharacterized protein LOC113774219 [Coffea eugenioides]
MPEPNPEPRINPIVQAAAAIQRMTDLLAHVMEQQGHNPNPLVGNPENPRNHIESEDRTLERFQKFFPPKFLGRPDPDVAESWLEKMVDIFAVLHYSEERQRLNVEIQKDLAVVQINTFSEAVEKALRVENVRLQVRNFQVKKRGFPASSSSQGDKGTPPKFGREAGGGRLLGMAQGTPPRGGQTGRGEQRSASQGSSVSISRGPYRFCRKPNHIEDNCWRKERKCLRCGSAEHQIANCLVLLWEARVTTQSSKATSGQSKMEGTKPKVPTRVYSLEQRPVPDFAEVVEGTIPIFHRLGRILIDPGATYSFINPDFMCGIDIKLVSLSYDLKVSTPPENQCLITSMMYVDCEIWVGERKLLGNLISLAIQGYDVILGIDWLAKYDAQLDCKRNVVELRIPGEATLRLDVRGSLASSALISGIRVRKLLSRGAQEFLTFLINTLTDKLNIEDVPIVGEYPNVFPDELVNLPPEREIEFEINLLPGTL